MRLWFFYSSLYSLFSNFLSSFFSFYYVVQFSIPSFPVIFLSFNEIRTYFWTCSIRHIYLSRLSSLILKFHHPLCSLTRGVCPISLPLFQSWTKGKRLRLLDSKVLATELIHFFMNWQQSECSQQFRRVTKFPVSSSCGFCTLIFWHRSKKRSTNVQIHKTVIYNH